MKYFDPHFWETCYYRRCGDCPYMGACFASRYKHQKETEKWVEGLDPYNLSAVERTMLEHAVKKHGIRFDLENGRFYVDREAIKLPSGVFSEVQGIIPPVGSPLIEVAAGFRFARGFYYHRGHTWARVEYLGRVRIGLDDFAAKLVGPVDGFELPDLGQVAGLDEHIGGLSREGNQARFISPLDGVVVARNPRVKANPGLVNDSPYEEGWLLVVEPTRLKKNLRELMFDEDGQDYMEDEAGRLSALVADETGHQLAATGGEVISDIFGQVPGLSWDRIVQEFLLN